MAAVVLLGLASAAAATSYAAFLVWWRGEIDEAPGIGSIDAIVVLGAAQYDGQPSPVFRARLDHAIALWRAGRAPRLVMTGGRRAGDRTTEAATARAYAAAQGVPIEAILMENQSRSTLESLEAVAAILAEISAGPVLFVSDRTHMFRVILLARDLGIDAYGSPAPGSPTGALGRRRIEATLHELGALARYGLVGGTQSARPTAAG
ncbi:MAG TPA: YdcF family protein [Patescibacteria group bacterium]|nr:YdcF family protein [Patescibacteria group bacterium]